MKLTINRLYEFLLADPQKDADYTEGNIVGGYKVYGTALEMKDKFSQAFGKQPIPFVSSLLGVTPIWHVEDCTIRYCSKIDREIPNNPECFGYLTVVGYQSNLDIINGILTDSFPGIDTLVKDCEY